MFLKNSCPHALLLRAGILSALALPGCVVTRLASDQGQVDPVVKSDHSRLLGQATPYLPDCTVQQWVNIASGNPEQGNQPVSCRVANLDKSDSSFGKGGMNQQSGADHARAQSTSFNYTILRSSSPEADKDLQRTNAQAELMTYSDQVCDMHLAGIYGTSTGANFELGWLTTLLSGGAALSSGRSAQNLAGGSALFSGTRSLFNSEFYQGYLGTAVITEVVGLRSDLRQKIAAKRSCSVAAYPPAEAINDALIYHNACSFSTGLASLLNKAGINHVGEDKLRTAQAAIIKSQLDDYQSQINKLEEKTPLDDQKIAQINSEMSVLKGLQRINGAFDPNGGLADQNTANDQMTQSIKKDLDDLQNALNKSTSANDPDVKKLLDDIAKNIRPDFSFGIGNNCAPLPAVVSH